MPIDQRTGQEIPADVYIDALKTNFLSNAQALIGTNAALQYVNSIDNDINQSKVSAISQYLNTDPSFANSSNGIDRLLRGDAGSASNAFQSLLPEDRERVIGDYRSLKAQRRADMESAQSQADRAAQVAIRQQIFKFHDPNTSAEERVQIGRELATSNAITVSQIETYLNPNQTPGDPVVFERIKREVQRGTYNDITQIEKFGAEAGMNQTQISQLVATFTLTESRLETASNRLISEYTGVPEQAFVFASDAEKLKYKKKQDVTVLRDELVAEFRIQNPNAAVPFDQLSQEAIRLYESTSGSANKEQQVFADIQLILENEAQKAEKAGKPELANAIRNLPVSADMVPLDLESSGYISGPVRQTIEANLLKLRQ
jgi:hypothetical protein